MKKPKAERAKRNNDGSLTFKGSRRKWYELDPKKHGLRGLTVKNPGMKPRKEDRRATPHVAYAVIFFPQYKLGFRATCSYHEVAATISQTPEAARIKYADRIGGEENPDKKWAAYYRAGHRVRKIKIIDLGPA